MSLKEKLIICCLLIIPFMFISMYCSTGQPDTSSQTPDKSEQNSSDPEFDMSKAPSSLVIALTPSIDSGQIVKENKELDKILSDYIGIPVETKIIQSYLAAIQGLASGKIDCGMVHPLGYVIGKEKFPMEVFLKVKRDGATEYNSQIIVNSDSGINTIQDLNGHTFAFVDTTSTSGYLYPMNLLKTQGINPMEDFKEDPIFSGSHDKVALDVLFGIVDAGATFQDVRERLQEKHPDIMEKTKMIAVAGPIPNQLFCIKPDLDPEFKQYLAEKLIELSKGIEIDGEIVKPFFDYDNIEELLPANDSDYDPVRDVINNLDIDLLKEATKSE